METTKATRYPANPFRTMTASKVREYIMRCFLLRLPVDPRAPSKIAGDGSPGGWGGRAYYGPRMSVDSIDGRVVLRSYKMILAVWIDDKLVLNGDGAPSADTGAHQRELRDLIQRLNGFRYVPCPQPEYELWTEEWRQKEVEAGGYDNLRKDPAWIEHSAKWSAERNSLEKAHVYHQKVAKHCGGCGGKLSDPGDPVPTLEEHFDNCSGKGAVFQISYTMIPLAVLGYDTWSGGWSPSLNNAALRLRDIEVVDGTEDKRIMTRAVQVFRAPIRNAYAWGGHIWKPRAGKYPNRVGCLSTELFNSAGQSFAEAMVCPHCKVSFGKESEHRHEVEQERHFLGETLFRAFRPPNDEIKSPHFRYYVCGLDRNDHPGRRKFYMAGIPGEPTTVDEALRFLKPVSVGDYEARAGKQCPRQGEWFLIPIDPEYEQVTTGILISSPDKEWKKAPIVSDSPLVQGRYNNGTLPGDDRFLPAFRDRERRHVAYRMRCHSTGVYVKGTVRDMEHDTTYLGDGWHRVVRNLAKGSWSVDPKGPKVD